MPIEVPALASLGRDDMKVRQGPWCQIHLIPSEGWGPYAGCLNGWLDAWPAAPSCLASIPQRCFCTYAYGPQPSLGIT